MCLFYVARVMPTKYVPGKKYTQDLMPLQLVQSEVKLWCFLGLQDFSVESVLQPTAVDISVFRVTCRCSTTRELQGQQLNTLPRATVQNPVLAIELGGTTAKSV